MSPIKDTYYKPHALHNNSSSADLRHRGVLVAPQFVHTGFAWLSKLPDIQDDNVAVFLSLVASNEP